MDNRFSTIQMLDEHLWSKGSPVELKKGALLADNLTGKSLLQLKFSNLSANSIKAVIVKIELFDINGGPLGSSQFSFLDLNIGNGDDFGGNTPVWLDASTARDFVFVISSVVFHDGSTWSNPEPLRAVSADPELGAQYLYAKAVEQNTLAKSIDDFKNVRASFLEISGYKDVDQLIAECDESIRRLYYKQGMSEKSVAKTESDFLSAASRFRMATGYEDADTLVEECEKSAEKSAEESKCAADKRKSQIKRSLVISSICVAAVAIVLVAIIWVIPSILYNRGLEQIYASKYSEAAASFGIIKGYKNSKYLCGLAQCGSDLSKGEGFFKEGNYEDALQIAEGMRFKLKPQKRTPAETRINNIILSEAYILEARIYARQENYSLARSSMLFAMKMDGSDNRDDYQALLKEAAGIYYKYAIQELTKKSPDYLAAKTALQQSIECGGYKDAQQQLDRVLQDNGNEQTYNDALYACKKGDVKTAIRLLKSLPVDFSNSKDVLAELTRLQNLEGTYKWDDDGWTSELNLLVSDGEVYTILRGGGYSKFSGSGNSIVMTGDDGGRITFDGKTLKGVIRDEFNEYKFQTVRAKKV